MIRQIELQERGFEIASCVDALDSALQSNGSSIVVHGGAGAGKSALLNEVTAQARARGFDVVRFRGSHADHDSLFDLAVHLERFLQAQLTSDEDEAAAEALATDVSALLDTRRSHANPQHRAEEQTFREFLPALNRLTERLASKPLLISIDNLHWVDSFSMRWLPALLDRLHRLPLVVVATVCDGLWGTDPDLLEEVIVAAERRLELRPLGLAGTAAVVEAVLREAPHAGFLEAAKHVTGGNPLLLEALLGRVIELEIRPDRAGAERLTTLSVDSLALSLRVRLRRLSPEAISIFRIAAILDGDSTVQNIADLSGLHPAEIADSGHAMRKLGLLSFDGTKIVITQPLMARSVMRDSSPTVLRTAHSQAALLLHECGAPDDRIAAHLLVGGAMDDNASWVLKTLRTAAQHAIDAKKNATATRYLRRALEEPLEPAERAAILTDLALVTAGENVDAAVGLVRQALKLAPDQVGRHAPVDLLVLLALAEHRDEVRRVCDAAPDDKRPDLVGAWVLLERLVTGCAAGQPLPPEATQGRGPIPSLLRAGETAASVRDFRDDWVRLADEAAQGVAASATRLMTQLAAARVLAAAGEVDSALRLSASVVSTAEAHQLGPVLAVALTVRSHCALRSADFTTALDDGRRALAVLRAVGFRKDTSVFTAAVTQVVDVLIATGSTDEACALLGEVGLNAAEMDAPVGSRLFYAQGRLRLLNGDPRGALRDLIACGELLTAQQVHNPAVAAWRSQAAVCLNKLGDRAEARRLAEEELSLARAWGAPGPVAAALQVGGVLAEPSRAPELFEEAIALLRSSDERLGLAQALCEHARSVSDREIGSARQSLREAYELAAEFGNEDFTSRIRDELVLLGGRLPRARRQGVDSLTESERRVAMLAAQGWKNREIAATLYVQRRTVEIHLTNAYRKLKINSRDELADVIGQNEHLAR
jgi:DNA-binding CsgD family transcriptional regulator